MRGINKEIEESLLSIETYADRKTSIEIDKEKVLEPNSRYSDENYEEFVSRMIL